jgi:hypothetical protein
MAAAPAAITVFSDAKISWECPARTELLLLFAGPRPMKPLSVDPAAATEDSEYSRQAQEWESCRQPSQVGSQA